MTLTPEATRTLDLGEVVLAYEETGRGRPVVYAHGLSSSRAGDPAYTLNDWSPLVASGYRLIRYDARGHGESSGRPEAADYTWPHLAGDLRAVARASREIADLAERRGLQFVLEATKDLPPPPIHAEHGGALPPPAIPERLYPHVMRGAADCDLPDPESLRALTHPALILAWAGDPGHPLSTAEALRDLMPNSRLHVSAGYRDVRTWGERAAAFLVG